MLTIENIHKIVDKKIIIPHHPDWIGRVKDVYYMSDNTYVFQIQLNALNYLNNKEIKIVLNRKRPVGIYPTQNCWELSYEIGKGSNRYEVQLVENGDVKDISRFGIALGSFTNRILLNQ
jgi:hypothetical protein